MTDANSTPAPLAKLAPVYSGLLLTVHEVAVSEALDAVRAGTCTDPAVIAALESLDRLYQDKASAEAIESGERAVAEAWLRRVIANQTFVVRMGQSVSYLSLRNLDAVREYYRPGYPELELVPSADVAPAWVMRIGDRVLGTVELTSGV